MKDIKPYDVVIVGGGPAGLVAGLYCRRADLNTVLFEKSLLGGQISISKEVENYPGIGDITGFALAEKMLQQAQAFGLSIVPEEVAEVHPGSDLHAVRLGNGDIFSTHTLILATGGSARKLGIPGETEYLGRGVSYCGTCDGHFFRNKALVVVGGGDTAVEEAGLLSRLAASVVLIHRGNRLSASSILQRRLEASVRITVMGNTIIREIRGEGGSVGSVWLENTTTGKQGNLATDGVFIFIGYMPNVALVPPGLLRDERGFVITNEDRSTNIPGIFAAGDLRRKPANQIVIAAADGCIAALSAARYVEQRSMTPEHA